MLCLQVILEPNQRNDNIVDNETKYSCEVTLMGWLLGVVAVHSVEDNDELHRWLMGFMDPDVRVLCLRIYVSQK